MAKLIVENGQILKNQDGKVYSVPASGEPIDINIENGSGSHSISQIGSEATGQYSAALGYDTKTKGKGSLAEGWSTVAGTDENNAAHAEGFSTQALGDSSHAEGNMTIASGNYAHAEGLFTIAWGQDSHAEGSTTEAINPHSHSEGYNTVAYGSSSHAEGEGLSFTAKATGSGTSYTLSIDLANIKVGYGIRLKDSSNIAIIKSLDSETSTVVTSKSISDVSIEDADIEIIGGALDTQAHSEGYHTTASGTRSHAEGYFTRATGSSSHAEGDTTEASNIASHAEGNKTVASGYYAHAEGNTTTASGAGAHAEGRNNTASGIYSHAEGGYNHATNDYAHAGGLESRALGKQSFAHGRYLYARNENQFVVGQYNKDRSTGLFVVGSGTTSNDRKNALEVFEDGTAVVGAMGTDDLSVATKKYVDGKIDQLLGEDAHATLDTIGEISKALKDNAGIVDVLNNAIGNKADLVDGKVPESQLPEPEIEEWVFITEDGETITKRVYVK